MCVAASDGIKVGTSGDGLVVEFDRKQVRPKLFTQGKATFINPSGEQRACISALASNTAGSSAIADAQSIIV